MISWFCWNHGVSVVYCSPIGQRTALSSGPFFKALWCHNFSLLHLGQDDEHKNKIALTLSISTFLCKPSLAKWTFELACSVDHFEWQFTSRWLMIQGWCHLQDPLGALLCAFGLLSAGGVLMFIEPLHVPWTTSVFDECLEGWWVPFTVNGDGIGTGQGPRSR